VKFCLVKDDPQPDFRVGFRGSGFRNLSAKLFFAPEGLKKMNVQHRPSEIEKKFHGVKMLNESQEQEFYLILG
jgi:hypothetical protein